MTDDDKRRLQEEFDEIAGRAWTQLIVKPGDPIPDLFHYTNAAGLLGILKSRSLWATDFQSLNDPEEVCYGIRLISDFADKLPEEERYFVRSAMDPLGGDSVAHEIAPYLVSFSDDGSLQSQWREYGDGGAGFSIAFDLERSSSLFGDGTSPLKITYDPKVQHNILSATIEDYWRILQEWKPKCGQEQFDLPPCPMASIEHHCQKQLASLLLTECATLKHPHHRGEQEWRLLRLGRGNSPLQFRTSRAGIVPYIELTPPSGQKLPIKRVVLGPTTAPAHRRGSVQALLKGCGYDDVEVEVEVEVEGSTDCYSE